MTAVNEITGNRLVSRASNQEAYAANFDNIFRKGKGLIEDKSTVIPMMIPESTDPYVHENIVTCCGRCGNGICETKVINYDYYREEDFEGNIIDCRTEPRTVSKCCGGDVFYWDVEKDEEVVV